MPMTTIITGPFVLFEVRALGEATVSGVLYEAKTPFVETVSPSVTWHQPLNLCWIFMKFGIGLHYKMSSKHEFRENRLSDALLSGV